jgi:hypothetical protein
VEGVQDKITATNHECGAADPQQRYQQYRHRGSPLLKPTIIMASRIRNISADVPDFSNKQSSLHRRSASCKSTMIVAR